MMRQVYRLLLGSRNKKNTLWLVGKYNSGKSTFCQLIYEIFPTDKIQFFSNCMPKTDSSKPELLR